MNDQETLVLVRLETLNDLMAMARQSPQYRQGQSWTAITMNTANRAANHAMIRAQRYQQANRK
jgi:hypothetical protein